jgi:hypothetical protein
MPQRPLSSSPFPATFRDAATRFTAVRCQTWLTVCQRQLTQPRGMAPSAYLLISGQMALAPIPGSCAVELRQIHRQKNLCPNRMTAMEAATGAWFPGTIGGAPGGRPAIGTFHLARQSGEWRLPPIHGFPGQWRWRQFPVVAPLNPGKSFGSKQWRRDQMTAIMPASGGWFRTRWVPHQAADVQLARSTYMTLAGQSHLRHRFTWMKEQGVA